MRDFKVAPIGLEPIQTEPESAVLPLHHKAKRLSAAKINFFSYRAQLSGKFFMLQKGPRTKDNNSLQLPYNKRYLL